MRRSTITRRSIRSSRRANRAKRGSIVTSTTSRGSDRLNFDAAAAYAERHDLHAMLVVREGEPVFSRFGTGYDASTPHPIYSGTKSFWGVAALAAQEEGLLELDEPVSATFPAWAIGPKGRVTLRMLLALVAGIGFGGLGNAVPTYAAALDVELKAEPGSVFTYGGIPLQVFGAVLAQKLAPLAQSPQDFLCHRVLEPLGMRVAAWRSLKDGSQPLPTGATVGAAEWAKFGQFVLAQRSRFAPCFEGSAANARYGLGWWLSPLASEPGLAYASGAGGQAMYVIPSRAAVVVKTGKSTSYAHATFLKHLLK